MKSPSKEKMADHEAGTSRGDAVKGTPTPGERVCRAILGVMTLVREFIVPSAEKRKTSVVLRIKGGPLPAGKKQRFQHILLVEDDPLEAESFIGAIRDHYRIGEVTLHVAYGFLAAREMFSRENINLVITDLDLDEDGDGALLALHFKREKPHVIVLANSGSKMSNKKIVDSGADGIIGKDTIKLRSWLSENEDLSP